MSRHEKLDRVLYGKGGDETIKLAKIATAGVLMASHKGLGDVMAGKLDVGFVSGVIYAIKKLQGVRTASSEAGRNLYLLGEHGSISFFKYSGHVKMLEDGTIIRPGDLLGNVDLIKNIDKYRLLGRHDFWRVFARDFGEGMVALGHDIETGYFPRDVIAITGSSHLGGTKLAKTLGFDVEPENSLIVKSFAAAYAVSTMREPEGQERRVLAKFAEKWGDVQHVWMSRTGVVKNAPLFRRLAEGKKLSGEDV